MQENLISNSMYPFVDIMKFYNVRSRIKEQN